MSSIIRIKKKIGIILSSIGFIYPMILIATKLNKSNYNLRVLVMYAIIVLGIYIFCSLFDRKKAKKIFIILSLIFSVIISIDYFLVYNFENTFTTNMSYIFFQTNKAESWQFFETYIKCDIILIILSIFAVSLIGIYFYDSSKVIKKRLSIISLIFLFLFFLVKGNHYYTPAILVKSYYSFKYENKDLNRVYSNKMGGQFTNVKIKKLNNSTINDTTIAVIIVGESATRSHMSLYGYPRETNPLLTKQKNLIAFNNVRSPHCSTTYSLREVFSYANKKNQDKVTSGSIMQLCNRAGFTTYWISNQGTTAEEDNIVTKFSMSCDTCLFTPGPKRCTSTIYDEAIFQYFDKVLKTKEKRKVIFLHLMGSHIMYKKRYPELYNYFKDDFPGKYYSIKSEDKIQKINEYDNSILYNDYIVNKVIEKVKKQNYKSAVLYFSDHGDDVYETNKDFYGHGKEPGTAPMHNIPFLLWLSDKYKQCEDYKLSENYRLSIAYNTENLMFSVADLLNIDFDEMDKSKSILFPF